MKRQIRFGAALLALVLLLTFGPIHSASAQSPAYDTSFTTSITYQNVGNAPATLSVNFYDQNSATAIPITLDSLAAGAGASVFLGSLNSISSSFQGSAVLSSDQPLVATMVQVPQSDTVKNRPLSNGFSGSDGANSFLIATTLKKRFNATTVFSVQNVSSSSVDIKVEFFDANNNGALAHTENHSSLPAGAAKYYDLGQIAAIPDNFNGSAIITATGGNIVAAAQELSTNSTGASSFEGVSTGASTVYMPSAICDAFGGQNSAYAIQNTSTSATANVTVEFSSGQSDSVSILPGAKASVQGCGVNAAGFSGSAKITSTGADIVAIGKVFGSGLSTAFVGATSGSDKIALPYVRWSESQYDSGQRQRTFIAIQNVGTSTATGVTVRYVDKDGNTVGTHNLDPISAGAKTNSNPSNVGSAAAEFGYVGGFGGGAIIEGPSGSQLVAIARVQSSVPASGSKVAEDYNGIQIQ